MRNYSRQRIDFVWLALLIISFKCSLKFSFVSTLMPSNFLYSLFLISVSSILIVTHPFYSLEDGIYLCWLSFG